ncbi:DNA repair protein RecN [Pusillimonas sp. CC-YST705]|uniref:DNA repair protein RecN n=1 Tax=Mesopusillimonas faecipullorum TaxID=2755040 RepID=A0ABS8C9L9_9BURK|nr:DNA repair protein RecN [Mesopusillimonas faecipullorum]MCB5362319.1 DNA repair protein RecN [Mesopusillimonas faecipullorum]
MLSSLLVRDFVIVDQAEIHFSDGFTVFSGETGAGKSILIDALSLALGARGDTASVREGCERADISAVFTVPESMKSWLDEHHLESDGTLILRRVLDTQGRSRAYVNGVPATLTQLRELGEQLVDIHGQHAHQSLMRPGSQRDMLDAQGGHTPLAQQVRASWQSWQQAEQALRQAQQDQHALLAQRQRLEDQLEELGKLGLKPGEWETLTQNQTRLAHAQAILEGSARALSLLDGEETGIQRQLRLAAQTLQNLVRHDSRLQSICDAIESAHISVTEAASDLQSHLHDIELDPDSLARIEQRMSTVFETARKYRVEPEELLPLLEQRQAEHAASLAGTDLAALQAQVEQARSEYDKLAEQLGKARRKTAQRLAEQVSKAMQGLAMEGGSFEVALEACPPSSHGNENIEFLVAGHAGTRPRPLGKVASGGELARLSLALSVIASQAARVPTLIFDEVDTGVGGAVAEVVGRLLRELGNRHQVLCVTHLPQVASCGMHHYKVEKARSKNTTLSSITLLNQEARVEEVARMLGGIKLTEATRTHARELLQTQA